MQLLDFAGLVEQGRLPVDFAVQVIEVFPHAILVARHDLVAGAVVAEGVTERDMNVQRQRRAALVAGERILPIFVLRERLVELQGGRIGRIARPAAVVAADQVGIENDGGLVRHGFDDLGFLYWGPWVFTASCV